MAPLSLILLNRFNRTFMELKYINLNFMHLRLAKF